MPEQLRNFFEKSDRKVRYNSILIKVIKYLKKIFENPSKCTRI